MDAFTDIDFLINAGLLLIAGAALYWGVVRKQERTALVVDHLRELVSDRMESKVDDVECVTKHAAVERLLSEAVTALKAENRVTRGGIRVIHQSLLNANLVDNPPMLPDEFRLEEEAERREAGGG